MRNGKRLYGPAFKVWIVEQAIKPGVPVASQAMRHGIDASHTATLDEAAALARGVFSGIDGDGAKSCCR